MLDGVCIYFSSRALSETHSSFLQHSSVQITHKFGLFCGARWRPHAAGNFFLSDENEKSLTSEYCKKDVSDLDDCPEEAGAIVLIGFVPLLLAIDHKNRVEKFGMLFKIWS